MILFLSKEVVMSKFFAALGALLIIFGLVKLALAMIQKHGEDA